MFKVELTIDTAEEHLLSAVRDLYNTTEFVFSQYRTINEELKAGPTIVYMSKQDANNPAKEKQDLVLAKFQKFRRFIHSGIDPLTTPNAAGQQKFKSNKDICMFWTNYAVHLSTKSCHGAVWPMWFEDSTNHPKLKGANGTFIEYPLSLIYDKTNKIDRAAYDKSETRLDEKKISCKIDFIRSYYAVLRASIEYELIIGRWSKELGARIPYEEDTAELLSIKGKLSSYTRSLDQCKMLLDDVSKTQDDMFDLIINSIGGLNDDGSKMNADEIKKLFGEMDKSAITDVMSILPKMISGTSSIDDILKKVNTIPSIKGMGLDSDMLKDIISKFTNKSNMEKPKNKAETTTDVSLEEWDSLDTETTESSTKSIGGKNNKAKK